MPVPITYIRSSLANGWELCANQNFMIYFLGWKNHTGKAACKGTIFHKVMEGLAHIKVAQQEKRKLVTDEVFGELDTEKFDINLMTEMSFDYYKNQPKKVLEKKDLNEIKGWVEKALAHKNGLMNPLNCEIVCPEIAFDIEIPYDWARFDYEVQGQSVQGQLCIKGTSDLLIKVSDTMWEIRDWKTGQRKDFKTGEIKDLEYFQTKDFQLRLYHYAITKMFPELEELLVSIYYVNSGGVFTVSFGKDAIEETEQLLKQHFETIKNTELPGLLSYTNKHFICKYCCSFSQEKSNGQSWCQFIHEKIKQKGVKEVVDKYKKETHQLTEYKQPGAIE